MIGVQRPLEKENLKTSLGEGSDGALRGGTGLNPVRERNRKGDSSFYQATMSK